MSQKHYFKLCTKENDKLDDLILVSTSISFSRNKFHFFIKSGSDELSIALMGFNTEGEIHVIFSWLRLRCACASVFVYLLLVSVFQGVIALPTCVFVCVCE